MSSTRLASPIKLGLALSRAPLDDRPLDLQPLGVPQPARPPLVPADVTGQCQRGLAAVLTQSLSHRLTARRTQPATASVAWPCAPQRTLELTASAFLGISHIVARGASQPHAFDRPPDRSEPVVLQPRVLPHERRPHVPACHLLYLFGVRLFTVGRRVLV